MRHSSTVFRSLLTNAQHWRVTGFRGFFLKFLFTHDVTVNDQVFAGFLQALGAAFAAAGH